MILDGAGSGRLVAIREDEPTAMYSPVGMVHSQIQGSAQQARETRVVVELRQNFGGIVSRALLGAKFTPIPSDSMTIFEIPFGDDLSNDSVTDCRSELGSFLAAGLPRDFADAVHVGLVDVGALTKFPSGLLRVDRAGFDEVGSSEMSFQRAGILLRRVMSALLDDDDPIHSARDVMSEW